MINLVSKRWELKNIDTVLFDKDGTFIDLHYFWGKMTEMRVNEIIEKFNLSSGYFNQLCLFLGYDTNSKRMLSDGITALYSRVKIIEIFREKLKEFNINATEEEITKIFDEVSLEFYKDIEKYTKPIDEAIEFIKKLRENGIKVGIVTSDSIQSTMLTIKNFGWENLFDVVIGRESTKEVKESGIPTKLALEKLNSNPKNTVMIGDAPMDYISAKNAGVNRTILVATGQLTCEELSQTSEYVLKSLGELECSKI